MMIQSDNHHGYQPTPPPRPPSSSSRKKSARIRPPSREQTSYNLFESDNPEEVVDFSQRDVMSRASSTALSRPSSSLSKYRPLPPIGFQQNSDSENANNSTQFVNEVTDSLRKLQINISVPSVDEAEEMTESEHRAYQRRESRPDDNSTKRYPYIPNSSNTKDSTLDKSVLSSTDSAIDTTYPQETFFDEKPQNETDLDLHHLSTSDKYIVLALKLPNGERLQGKFSPTTRLKSVLRFAEKESGCDFKGFSLIQNSPKKIYSRLSETLSECGITDRMLLFVDTDD